jgi:hypothetical protein
VPVTLVNFVEGTSGLPTCIRPPYRHPLSQVGRTDLALQVMGDQLAALLDLTIQYPPGPVSWRFVSGRFRVGDDRVAPDTGRYQPDTVRSGSTIVGR